MKQYLELMKDVLDNNTEKEDRTGTGTISVFGRQMRFNLQDGFPLVTTKKCHLRSIIHELLWFLKGDTNIKYLNDNGVTIWDEWALKEDETKVVDKYGYELVEEAISKGLYKGSRSDLKRYLAELNNKELAFDYFKKLGLETTKVIKAGKVKGDLGPVYGKQWRDWVGPNGEHIDQVKELIELLKNDPDSRRIIVSAWNVGELKDMALMPCHSFFQFYTCKLSYDERIKIYFDLLDKDEKLNKAYKSKCYPITGIVGYEQQLTELMDEANIPTRKISCQLYQRKLHCAF